MKIDAKQWLVLFAISIVVGCGKELPTQQPAVTPKTDHQIVLEACGAMKSTQAIQECNHAAEQIKRFESGRKDGMTDELITFRGIPFGEPGANERLYSMCLEDAGSKEWRRTYCDCIKTNADSCSTMMQFGTLDNTSFNLSPTGALRSAHMVGDKDRLLAVGELLKSKYGPPDMKVETLQNRMGATFEKMTLKWIDRQGTHLTLQSIAHEVDEGDLVIESAERFEERMKEFNEAVNDAEKHL